MMTFIPYPFTPSKITTRFDAQPNSHTPSSLPKFPSSSSSAFSLTSPIAFLASPTFVSNKFTTYHNSFTTTRHRFISTPIAKTFRSPIHLIPNSTSVNLKKSTHILTPSAIFKTIHPVKMIFRNIRQPNRKTFFFILSVSACLLIHAMGAPIAPATTFVAPFVLHTWDVFFLTIVLTLASSFVKSLNVIPYAQRSRVDKFFYSIIGFIISMFFFQHVSAAATAGDLSFLRFFQFFVAGGICAFLTHAVCTPIDVIKTRIQTTQGKYSGMVDAFKKIVSEEGASTLLKGLGATASGYFLHGAFKYSFYEVFKVLFSPNAAIAIKPPLAIAALAGFFAECIACLLLCPMEAIRIRSVADATFPSGVGTGLTLLMKTEGIHGWYKGLPAMLLKQVPYTVGQFVSFELAVTIVKGVVRAFLGITSDSAYATISSLAGLLAGIIAAVISHPGDTILSKINQEESEGSAVSQIVRVARSTGFIGLFLGLGPRIIQVGCMIGGQFLIYDSIKLWCGITPASALPSAATVAATTTAVTASAAVGNTAIRVIQKLPR